MRLDHITIACFGSSYALALLAELLHLAWPRAVPRFLGLAFGLLGFFLQTTFLFHAFAANEQGLSLRSLLGSTLFLSWILAIFYLYGTVHHRRQAWAVFVLPLVLALIGLTVAFPLPREEAANPGWFHGRQVWGLVHSVLLLLAAVGICVAFIASIMYLVQARRLREKILPRKGLQLLSLERLEEMNRRAILLAFPLLTAGLLVGLAQLLPNLRQATPWTDLRVLGAAALWLVFAILLYLRYGYSLRGRRVAFLTIVAFFLLMFTLVTAHTGVQGGGP
jgi:ABC-type transport system involved in cytochrome c biogenesis permease subunit